MSLNKPAVEALVKQLLEHLDPHPDRADLAETPRRVADFWAELLSSEKGEAPTTFASDGTDQMVVVSGMRVWSVCEHHLLPFWCDVSVGYMPVGRVLGLSKFARIARQKAGALQTQERLVEQIAATVAEATGSDDVAVIARGEHTCMTMRGVRTRGLMTSSSMRGKFRDEPTVRAEFLALATSPA